MVGFDVKGKVCLVTGGAQGLGKEFASKLLSQGGRVCLSDINEERGLGTVKEFVEKCGFSPEDVTFCRYFWKIVKNEDKVFYFSMAGKMYRRGISGLKYSDIARTFSKGTHLNS